MLMANPLKHAKQQLALMRFRNDRRKLAYH